MIVKMMCDYPLLLLLLLLLLLMRVQRSIMARAVCDDDLSDVSNRLRSVSVHLRHLHVRLRAK